MSAMSATKASGETGRTTGHRGTGRWAVAVGLTASMALTGCGGGDGEGRGEITLTVTDTVSAPGLTEALDEMIQEFTDRHDNVTVERTTMAHGDYQATALLDATGPNPPDVFEGNIGWSLDGPLVQAGALLPLDEYDEKYGWSEALGADSLTTFRFAEDGTQWGTGDLYGVAQRGDLVKVFYNRELLADLELEVPATLGEFEESLGVAADAGLVPIAFGNSEQWPGNHTYAAVQNAMVDSPDAVRDWILGAPDARFDTEASIRAAERLANWAEEGYFTEGFNGLSHDDVWPTFTEGEALYMITGSWMNSNFSEAMGDGVGMFLMPRETPGEDPVATGGLADPWHISAQTEHPELAAELLSVLVGETAANTELSIGGGITGYPVTSDGVEGVKADSLEAFRDASADGRLVPYLDFATPDMGDVLFPAVQELLDGRIDPETFVTRVQDASEDFTPA